MVRIIVYFDGFFNESNNYLSFSVSEITIIEHMYYKELYTSLISKLGSIIDMNNIDIYIFLGPIECVKNDLAITMLNEFTI